MAPGVIITMMLSEVCLTSVAYIRSVGGVCGQPAGWHVLADQARPAWLKAAAVCFHCRPGRGISLWPPTCCFNNVHTCSKWVDLNGYMIVDDGDVEYW